MEGIKLILIDIDDCMLPTDGGVYPGFFTGLQRIAKYIKRANNGSFPRVGWCTGRDRNYVEAFSFCAGLPNSWSVIESGIALFNPATKEIVLNPALTPEIREAFEEISQKRIPKILERYPGLFLYPGNMINVALERKHGFSLPIEECYEVIRQEMVDLVDCQLVTIYYSRIAVDISPAGIDKASGVQLLSEKTGVNLAEILGIDDSRGGFPMLKLVGYVGCPFNSSKECKELVLSKGGYISRFKYASGVADVIRHFLPERARK